MAYNWGKDVVTACGLALFHCWLLIPIFVVPPSLPVDAAYSWMRVGSMVALVAILLLSGRIPSFRFRCCSVVFSALLLTAGSSSRAFMGFSLLGQLVSGMGFAGMFLAWGRQFGSMNVKDAGVSIAFSGLAASFVCIVVVFFQQQMGLMIASWLPPVSAVVLIAVMGEPSSAVHPSSSAVPPPDERQQPDAMRLVAICLQRIKPALPWKLALAIAVYSMIFEFMLRATVQGSAAFFSQTTLGIFVCFGIVSLAVVFLERRLKQGIDLSISYCAIVVFMLAAILLVSVATEDYLALPRCIATVGFLLFWLLAMITYANISALQEGKVLPVFAWGLFAEQAGELMGSSFELFERFSPGTAILGISGKTMASFAVALLLIVATILILSRKDAFARNDRTNPIAPVPSFEGRCSDLAERFGLSKREQDVLLLLAQGRSNPYVKAELLVSESTVNTHVKSIYRKLGIHSRQDLLDIIHADG